MDSRSSTTELLQPNTVAPDFCLPATPDQKISLHEFRGSPAVLVFYPADWSPVCGDELVIFNEVLPELKHYKANVLGISVDNVWSHIAYAQANHIHFPLLSDFEPKGAVSKSYGAYESSAGVCSRALFVISGEGIIYWSYVSPIGVNPGADGVLDALSSMSRINLAREVNQ
jgi:peroxiredoxin